MSDERPRPQYGEYATPEEQRARIQVPQAHPQSAAVPSATGSVSPGTQPALPPVMPSAQSAMPSPRFAPAPAAAAARPARTRVLDRIVTFGLLAYGLVNVVATIVALGDFGDYAHTVLKQMGVDAQLADPAAAQGWVIAAAVVLIVGWLLTAWLSILSLRRGRLTWWIPLVAGVVFSLGSGVLLVIPIMGDAAVWGAVTGG